MAILVSVGGIAHWPPKRAGDIPDMGGHGSPTTERANMDARVGNQKASMALPSKVKAAP